MNLRKLLFFTAIIAVNLGIILSCTPTSPQDALTIHDKEINEIIEGMTLEEKVEMLHSKTIMSSEGIPRLGIPEIRYADGPFGKTGRQHHRPSPAAGPNTANEASAI